MATRLLRRRIFTIFSQKQSRIPLLKGSSLHHLPSTTVLLNDGTHSQVMLDRRRRIHTETELTIRANEDEETHEPRSDNCDTDSSSVKYTALSNLKASKRHDLAMIFTCKVCETRSVKTVCRESYEKGVVLARCGGCNNLHLIADRLGWFGEPGSIEDLLAARGEEVKKGSIDTLNLTLEDLAGTSSTG
ncbi:DNL-type zinc finger protein [Telopea speciosissima]|uniref:DNL-type zinc finger protein n=1 Tax=Telopea speciosissima TaxID=54955 RepID=UPI001CC5D203|nr:DNL-type zinc finger protein [Telopea speciosissima]